MILLIIVYWDDVGGFTLYPLREPKQDTHHSDAQATTGPPHSASTSSPFTASSTTPVPKERRRGAVEEQVEEEGSDKPEQRKETTGEHAEEEMSHTAVEGGEQEARKKRITDMCSGKDAVDFPGRTRTFEQIPNRELDHLIVDDTHQIIYCFVPKVQLLCMCVCLVYSVSVLKLVKIHPHTSHRFMVPCVFSLLSIQVACTNWKRVMVVLSQSLISPSSGKPYTDPEAIPPDIVHNSTLHLTFAEYDTQAHKYSNVQI